MSYMCRECGTVIMEDDKDKCPDCEIRYTRAAIEKAKAEEQEACANLCDEIHENAMDKIGRIQPIAYWKGAANTAAECSEAIHKRGEK